MAQGSSTSNKSRSNRGGNRNDSTTEAMTDDTTESVNASTSVNTGGGTVDDTRNVRQRHVHGFGLDPFDTTFNFQTDLVEVSIDDLMGPRPEIMKAVMYLQLLRIVSGSSTSQSNMSTYVPTTRREMRRATQVHHIKDFFYSVTLQAN